ncbi:MAG TPA: ester cyclase [Candidatus Sulfotelmatobacter sp.]|nr:ester cyclase [Candidatus Sulfotelmatobacter sp.]
MTQQEMNKGVVAQYVEAFNRKDYQAMGALFTPDAVIQGVLGRGKLEYVIEIWKELHTAFGTQLRVESMVAEGDTVAVRFTERGTFTGPFRGHEPTGKSFELVAMEWFLFKDGRIQHRWGARDSLSQARQIGLPLS